MPKLTRREFGKRLAVVSATAVVTQPHAVVQTSAVQQETNSVPDTIAGYRLSEEDKQLAAKFIANHDKTMAPLSENNLSNDLPPDIVFVSPAMRGENNDK